MTNVAAATEYDYLFKLLLIGGNALVLCTLVSRCVAYVASLRAVCDMRRLVLQTPVWASPACFCDLRTTHTPRATSLRSVWTSRSEPLS